MKQKERKKIETVYRIRDFVLEEEAMGKERVYSCAEDIAMRLKEGRKYGKASLMVGAGFSKNAKSRGMKDIKPSDWGNPKMKL